MHDFVGEASNTLWGCSCVVEEKRSNLVDEMSGEIGRKDWFLKLLCICVILFVKKELNIFATDLSSLPWDKTISGLRCQMPFSFSTAFSSRPNCC